MESTLTDKTMPGQTERRLVKQDVAWVWPTTIARPGMKTEASPYAGSSLHLRWDLEKPKTGSLSGETIGLPKSIERLEKTH